MAPSGNIHFHPESGLWSEDFSKENLSLQGLFIHEMTHVWQAQTRGRWYLPLMRHPFCRYSYRLVEGRPFDRYGLEQQAEIIRHRFLANQGHSDCCVNSARFPAVQRYLLQKRNSLSRKRYTPLFASAQ